MQRHGPRTLLAVVFTGVLLLGACGDDDDSTAGSDGGSTDIGDASGDVDDASGDTGSDSADEEAGADSADLDFPIPVPDGGTVEANTESEGVLVASVRYPLDRFDEVAAFFDDWARGEGLETEGMQGSENQQSMTATDSEFTYFVSMIVGSGQDTTVVSLSVTPLDE